ncbi:MAG: CoA transferase [Myxococcota bacterium]
MPKPIRDLHILEVEGSAAGGYAAKLFADRGAHVMKLPMAADRPGQRTTNGTTTKNGSISRYLDVGKDIQPTGHTHQDDSGTLREWLAWADVLLESSAPDPLVPLERSSDFPHLVRVRVSPFGSSGPYARYRSNAFSDDAIGGHLYLNGESDREPIGRAGLQSHYQAGLYAFIGALAALRARDMIGRGQIVDVSHFEGLVALHQHTVTMWTHGHHILMREGNRQPGIWHPAGIYPCKDGYVMLALVAHSHRDRFLTVAGIPEILIDHRFANDLTVGQNKEAFDQAILPWLLTHTLEEIIAVGRESRTPAGRVASPLQVLEDPHLETRGYWKESGGIRVPGRAFSIAEAKDPHAPPKKAEPSVRAPDTCRTGPLEGLCVLDLSRIWAGPLAGRILADLGADVIAVEAPEARGGRQAPPGLAQITHLFPDDEVGERPWNRIGSINEFYRNKRGITLDLKQPDAKRLFEELVRAADVVLENFSPRVMPELGLGFDRLRELNSSIVYTAISGYGSSGPDRDRLALGPVIEAASGASYGIGYPDTGPYRSGVAWTDPISGLHAVAATLCALHERQSESQPVARYVEVPMIESMVAVMGEQLMDAQRQGADPVRQGNRHPERAPQGVYPCGGQDRWLAISIEEDSEWQALCQCAGLDTWKLWTDPERRKRHDEIDEALAQWTRDADPMALEARLQSAGVIAVAVRDARDLCQDPQLAARKFWADTEHREAGRHTQPGCAIQLSETPISYRRAAPCLGEHNEEVLRELLGIGDPELERLRGSGILTDSPPEP